MGDENPIYTLVEYSRPMHEGYRNTIELPEGNNVVLLRSDTIRLVENGCPMHVLLSEDPNQHLKDFLKLVDSLDLDIANRERIHLRLFQFSLYDEASNWLERLPTGSISTGSHDTQYCIENLEQAFVDYTSSHTDKAGGNWYTFKPEQNNLGDDGDVIFIEIIKKNDDSHKEEPKVAKNAGVGESEDQGNAHLCRNFTYVIDFKIVEDISSIRDPRLSQVVIGKPFVEISNMTRDPPEGVVRFTNGTDEIAYTMPHMIEQYNSLSNLEREHTKSVYLKNEEDKSRGVEYVMRKILGFYKECLELGLEYATGIADEEEVTMMTTLAGHIIVAGAKNCPPMLEKSMYDSWVSRIRLFIKRKKNGRMMLDSINNGPLVYQTVEENGTYSSSIPSHFSQSTTTISFSTSIHISPGEDPIDCINKEMSFLSVVASRGNYAAGQSKVVKCYNCLGEGHMAKQCTQPKRPRNSAWFKEKLVLAEAQEVGQILDEEQLAFTADLGIAKV
nr:zinc finger, CCHC-type [Tanacetum cinerariifolium]